MCHNDYDFVGELTLEDSGEFEPQALEAARKEEIGFMKRIQVWEPSSQEECFRMTGRPPISTRWVDVDKGRNGVSDIRSRLVARDFKIKGDGREFEVFASMPPLEAKRILFRMAMAEGSVKGDPRRGQVKLMFMDIKKAHLNGRLMQDEYAYVELPIEAGGGVGRLRRWLYGMRPAASAWERDYAENLTKKAGFRRSRAAPVTFVHPVSDVRLVVWGDDFTFLGRDLDLKDLQEVMSQWYEVKVRGILGPELEDQKEIRILNRQLRWEEGFLEYEADDKHAQTIIEELGLEEDSKGSSLPLPREYEPEEGDAELDGAMARKYRRIAAVVNYLALDRPDLQFAAGVLGRTAAKPTTRSWANLKKVGRYLLEHPRVVFRYNQCNVRQALSVVVFSDSDWAGCRSSRRSVSGGVATIAGAIVKSWSNRQASVALSSAEAEFYAATRAATEAIGIRTLMAEMGWGTEIAEIHMDAEAATGMMSRRGLGRTKHLDIRFLWVQEKVAEKDLLIRKVSGATNPADVLTKLQPAAEAMRRLRGLSVHEPRVT